MRLKLPKKALLPVKTFNVGVAIAQLLNTGQDASSLVDLDGTFDDTESEDVGVINEVEDEQIAVVVEANEAEEVDLD